MSLAPNSRFLVAFAIITLAAAAALPAQAGSISLAWDPVSDSDLALYRVSYGSSPGSYSQTVDVGLATTHTLNGLTDCTTWYVAVKAVDDSGNVSQNFSNEVSGWPRPTLSGASPGAAEQGLTLDVQLSGTNFRSGASVDFDNPGITVNSVSVNGCGDLVANITVGSSAATGAASADVINPDQTFGTGAGVFTVQAAVAPTVTGTSPADGATNVAITVQPTVTFSEALAPGSVSASSVQLLDSSGSAVVQAAGSPAISGDGRTATITPASDLAMGVTYRIRVIGGASGVTDLAGNPLASTFTQSTGFTTSGDSVPPVISSVAAGAIGATSVNITWSTNETADSQVFYRVAGTTDYQQTPVDSALVTSHAVTVQGLVPDTAYEYHVRSVDGSGNEAVSSPDQTFTTATTTRTYLRFEAEGGVLTSPVQSTSGAGAFGGAWIDTPAGTSNGTANSPSGTAVYGINIPSSGTWYLWMRLFSPNSSGGVWYESIDGAGRQVVTVSTTDVWEWAPGRSYTLTAGLHSLELGGRRAEARVDRVILTDDPDFVPTEQVVGDTTPPSAPTTFTATGTNQAIALGWTNPSDSDLDRVIIRVRTDGVYPVSPVDGAAVTERTAVAGSADSFVHAGLTNGTVYRYSIFAVDDAGNVSSAAQAEGIPVDDVPPADVPNLRRTDTIGP